MKAKLIEDQKYLYKSKFLGGSAIFPKYSASERSKSIIEPDRAVAEYKLRFREKLAYNWAETVRMTQPYLFDPKINSRAGPNNLPESRALGYKIGTRLVSESHAAYDEDYKLAELRQQSIFARKGPIKGVKNSKILLARGENGGFFNAKPPPAETMPTLVELMEKH